ncbi:MAG: exonuclease, partial [Caldilineae bacterium]
QEPTASYLDSLRELHERLNGLIAHFDQVLYRPVGGDASTITWLAVSRGGQDAALCAAPLYAGEVVGAELLRPLRSVVLTGATLRTNEGFDFMQERLGCMGIKVDAIPSPFDYRANVLLYLPSDMPAPDRPGYQQTLEEAILTAAQAAGGRTLVLFTSHAHLRRTADGLRGACEELGLSLLEHGNGGRNRLLQAFRRDERSVLLGAGTFWEGIDLPGELLSCLIIVRLPFAVPTNPLLAARSTVYEDAFNEYVIPDAVIRFRQGFGRLVRRADDRGVVVILDSRIWRRGYGDAFLEALPACTQRHAPVMNLGETVADWLNKERLVF